MKYFLNDQRFKKEFNLNLRSKIKLNCKVENLNEKIIRYLLVELLPTIYLEGFKYLKDELKKSHLPSSPKTIFTRNCSQDTIFKFWLSEKVNNVSKLIHGQHGAAYGMITEHNNFKYELSICDRYLTWGWNLSGKKIQKFLNV